MVLTRQEKEKLILDLYNQGKTYKQIAETARVTPRDIKPVLENAEKEREKEGFDIIKPIFFYLIKTRKNCTIQQKATPILQNIA
jgi:hypothetical protein